MSQESQLIFLLTSHTDYWIRGYFLGGFIFANFASQSSQKFQLQYMSIYSTVEPRYNEVLGTMNITLLYQGKFAGPSSLYFFGKKERNIKSWDQPNVPCYMYKRVICYGSKDLFITRFHCTVMQTSFTNNCKINSS